MTLLKTLKASFKTLPLLAGLALFLALPRGAFGEGASTDTEKSQFLPEGYLFTPLLADPREIQLSAAYYRLNGNNDADVALGHSWGMNRWVSSGGDWKYQWDIEGMAFSRFQISGGINKFETIDFFANLPLEIRHGIYSGKFSLFHESSHLGDDYIRDTGDTGFRYSVEGVRALFSVKPAWWGRFYAGGSYLLHSIPTPQRGTLQTGFELKSHRLKRIGRRWMRLYLAQDIQSHENVQWNVNSNTQAGVRFARPEKEEGVSIRVFLDYFTGHSPYGQFFAEREHYAEIGVGFDFW